MNVLDSELVQGQLEALGYGFVEKSEEADIVLLNTCSVRELSEHKVWSALGRLAIGHLPGLKCKVTSNHSSEKTISGK